jgi:DNA-binding transcriptional LysR family regulator
MFSFKQLKQFIVVAEELHFGRAAARLHIEQPPLSQAIMRLEEIVGIELLARTKRAVGLTEAGRIFLEDARRLINLKDQAIERARHAREGSAECLTLGLVGSVSYGLLPEFLSRFRKEHPNVSFELSELSSIEQIEELNTKRIDAGILRVPVYNATGLNMRIVTRERMVAVLPAKHPLAHKSKIHLASLSEEKFVMFPANRVPSLQVKTLMACHAAGFSPTVALEAWQMLTVVSLVAAGMGIALIPSQIRNTPHPGVVFRDLLDESEHLDLEIAIAWRRDNNSQLLQRFIDSICQFVSGSARRGTDPRPGIDAQQQG